MNGCRMRSYTLYIAMMMQQKQIMYLKANLQKYKNNREFFKQSVTRFSWLVNTHTCTRNGECSFQINYKFLVFTTYTICTDILHKEVHIHIVQWYHSPTALALCRLADQAHDNRNTSIDEPLKGRLGSVYLAVPANMVQVPKTPLWSNLRFIYVAVNDCPY